MANCSILDVGCNLQNFAQWIYSFIAPYLDPILNLITSLLNLLWSIFLLIIGFVTALFNLGVTIGTYIFGVYYTIFSFDPTALAIVLLLQTYITIIIFARVWNLIADIHYPSGFKLPKIPL